MSDNFDPDAWPYPQGNRPQQGSSTARRQDDDYDDLSFDDQDFLPDDFDDVDASTTGKAPQPEYDSYAYEDEEPTTTVRTRPTAAADDDYGNDSYDGYEDEYEYDDDDYDREVESSGGNGRRLVGILAGLALLGALGVGAFALLAGGNDRGSVAQSPTTVAQQGANAGGLNPMPAEAPAEVTQALNAALAAWGDFAVTGNLDVMRPHFVSDTTQWAKFESEAREIQAGSRGGGPMQVTVEPDTTTETTNGDWLVAGLVTFNRSDLPAPQQYPWEFHLTRSSENGSWQVLKVRQY